MTKCSKGKGSVYSKISSAKTSEADMAIMIISAQGAGETVAIAVESHILPLSM